MKTHHSDISERELKHVIYFISYYFLWFVCWPVNIIVMEICPGRWNSMLFALLVIFNNYAMDKIDSGEVNNSMEYFGYILHCYCCIWLFFFGHILHWYYGCKFLWISHSLGIDVFNLQFGVWTKTIASLLLQLLRWVQGSMYQFLELKM